ncbi:hypothetical protein [Halosegnis marinus]|uniref:Uncharacterized protein n=1 Tax=Halosegnis marinus TaxID=3034023 RepID=A0ABD5ZSV5_9EURY|nr:hypothetical protein [Halosegnis sp. DT85]
MVALLAASGVAAAAVSFDNGTTPSPQINEGTHGSGLTLATYDIGDDPTRYEANDGSTANLSAVIPTDDEHPNRFTFSPVAINASDYRVFPTSDANVSAVDATVWSVAGANASLGMVADSETAPNVQAVRFQTDGSMAADDEVIFATDTPSITSDEAKRVAQVAFRINTLDAGTTAQIRFVDADGDYKATTIDDSLNASSHDVAASETGPAVWQEPLGNLTTQTVSGSDGTFDDLERIEVSVMHGDLDLEIAGLNVERMSEWQFGEQKVQTADEEWVTETITEPRGMVMVTDMDTLGPTFEDATIHNLEFAVEYRAELQPDDNRLVNISEAENNPSYAYEGDVYVQFTVPDQYDLTHSQLRLNDTQTLGPGRYQAVAVAMGTGDTAFGNISADAWTDKTGLYTGEGDTHTLSDSLQPGQTITVHYQLQLTEQDYEAMQASAQTQGGGGFFGNLWGKLLGVGGGIVGIVTGIGLLWGNEKRKSRAEA